MLNLPGTLGPVGAGVRAVVGRRAGHCEVTAIPNVVLGRRDEVGCPLFWPVDAIEAAARRRTQRTAA